MPVRSADSSTGDYDCGGAAVVADWEMGVVWLESVCGALGREMLANGRGDRRRRKGKMYSEHCANVEGVINTREEIGIVSDLHWQMCFRLMFW